MKPPEQRGSAIDAAQFDVLANSQRRNALCALSAMEQPVDLRTLAIRVTARELDKPASRVDPAEVRRRETRLYHSHLPKMEARGLVTFDADDRVVELQDSTSVTAALELLSCLDTR